MNRSVENLRPSVLNARLSSFRNGKTKSGECSHRVSETNGTVDLDEDDSVQGDRPHPPDIVESVQSNLPGNPNIRIEFADSDVTIAADSDEDEDEDGDEDDEDDDEDDEENPFLNRQKSKRSKVENLHSFF